MSHDPNNTLSQTKASDTINSPVSSDAPDVQNFDDDEKNELWDDDDENDIVACDAPSEASSTADMSQDKNQKKTPASSSFWELPDKDAARDLRAQSFKQFGVLGNFGLFLIVALIFGYVIGRALDTFFGTKPIFTVFWIMCASIASIREFVRSIKAAKNIPNANEKK